jgi:hypothetical protein
MSGAMPNVSFGPLSCVFCRRRWFPARRCVRVLQNHSNQRLACYFNHS